jgi:putative inorganic carbon (HCO3(-)) transporter
MALGLALFYWGGGLPLTLAGLLIFGALALLRPDLGLLFVPLTAPLYLIPAQVSGVRANGFAVPVHEAALLVVAAATAAGWIWRRVIKNQEPPRGYPTENRPAMATLLWDYAPHLLFLAAGVWGLAIAVERGPALIEFRRLIAEPLTFYVLLRLQAAGRRSQVASAHLEPAAWSLRPEAPFLIAFVLSGALVGLLGLLQYVGWDLVPYLGEKQCFAPNGAVCSNIVEDGGVRRVLSVYGHPNNLGLYLGRVWPLAAALAFAKNTEQSTANKRRGRGSLLFALCSLFCLGGLVVSVSRGAWLGALAAAAVLVFGLVARANKETGRQADKQIISGLPRLPLSGSSRSALTLVIGLGAALAVLAGLGLTLRGDVTAGSTPVRLLLWREAIGYLRQHPLGIGLDQFVYYHDPGSGHSLIDPSLIGTSEQYAAHPHNLLLDIWLRLGPLGLAAFGWLLARFFRAARENLGDPIVLGALAAMSAALVHGLVDNFYFVPDLAVAFWLLIGLVELGYRRAKNDL